MWSASFGRRTDLMIRFDILGDPEVVGEQDDYQASWGAFQLWVDGVNLCRHEELGEPMESIHWYLLPLFQWLAENWDPLFHEEQIALRESIGSQFPESGATLLRENAAAPYRIDGESLDHWESTWYSWWKRHHLWSARDGGLLPSVTMRRYREAIEVSWLPDAPAGAPQFYRFLNSGGVFRSDPSSIAVPLFESLRAFARGFAERRPDSAVFRRLLEVVYQISGPTATHRRIPWLIGLGDSYSTMVTRWTELSSALPALRDIVTQEVSGDGIVTPSTHAAVLMYGSVSPNIGVNDAVRLGEIVVHDYKPDRALKPIDELSSRGDLSHEPSMVQPWEDGYELAQIVRRDFIGQPEDKPLDFAPIFQQLGVAVRELPFTDTDLRGVSVAGSSFEPLIVMNSNSAYHGRRGGKRFTMAHELCHLVADRSFGGQLGIVSGQWAPREIERRANAFAAELLMPERAIGSMIAGRDPVPLDVVFEIADRYDTTVHAVASHLVNRGLISRANFDMLMGSLSR